MFNDYIFIYRVIAGVTGNQQFLPNGTDHPLPRHNLWIITCLAQTWRNLLTDGNFNQ